MKISAQRNKIGGWLTEQLSGYKAKVVTVGNQRKLWQEIYAMATDDSPRLVICFDGETARGGFKERNTLCRVDRQWVVVVMEGRGFVEYPKGGGDQQLADFNDVCEEVRGLLRRLISISAEAIDYVSMRPLPGVAQPNMANVHLDGIAITFTTANDISEITLTDPATGLVDQ